MHASKFLGIAALVIMCAHSVPLSANPAAAPPPAALRAEITDRNGVVLATTAVVASIYADPRHIVNPDATAAALTRLLPGLERDALQAKLASAKSFVWIARHVNAADVRSVLSLALPGIGVRDESGRIYPQGPLTAQVVGFTDLESKYGMAGAESRFDRLLTPGSKTLALSIDVRVQAMVREELVRAMADFQARGAAGLVLDVKTSELLALVSLPDFDPADRKTINPFGYKDRLTSDLYELGGVFEIFTTAAALEQHAVTPKTVVDVTTPLRFSRVTLRDDQPSAIPLSVADIFSRSSIIGAARIAERSSLETLLASLHHLRLLDPMAMDGAQTIARPIAHPANGSRLDRGVVGYGYGIAVSPLQAAVVATGIVNHGVLVAPTLLRSEAAGTIGETRIVGEQTSAEMRALLRRAVSAGTGAAADVPGLAVGGKTGTSLKPIAGRYAQNRRLTWFFAGFPMNDAPRYTLLIMLDEPHGVDATRGLATSQWNAVPTAGRIIARLARLPGWAPSAQLAAR